LASDDSHIAGLALRYANAVFELAAEERGIDRLAADFQTLKTLLRQSPELNRLVRSPLFSREDQSRGMQAVLAKAGTDKSRVLSATVYMADAALKDEMNAAWMAWVDRSNLPTRTAVGAVLTPGTLVEITICAAK